MNPYFSVKISLYTTSISYVFIHFHFLSEKIIIQSFPFSKLVAKPKAKEPSLSYYLSIVDGGRTNEFMPFQRPLAQN